MHKTKYVANQSDSPFLRPIQHLSASCITAEFCESLMDNTNTSNSSTFSILSLGPSMAISIFHQCLVRSWAFC